MFGITLILARWALPDYVRLFSPWFPCSARHSSHVRNLNYTPHDMANRVSGRFAPAPPPHVDLPTLSRPQVVDAGGFELTDEQLPDFAGEVIRAATAEPTAEEAKQEEGDDGQEGEEMEIDGEVEEAAEPMEVEEVEATEGAEPQEPTKQPLLDLAER